MTHVRAQVVAVLAAVFASALSAQSPTLDAIAAALGGRERVLAVRTLAMRDGSGDNFNVGQNLTPEAPLPRFEVTTAARTIDFFNRRWRLTQTRIPRFPTGNAAPQRQSFGIDSGVAYNVVGPDSMVRVGGQTAIDRGDELLDHPIGFLQAAFASGTEVVVDPAPGPTRIIRLNVGGRRYAMIVDSATMLPRGVQRLTDNALLGDVIVDTEFSDWRDVHDLRLPARFVQKLDGRWTVSDVRYAALDVDGEIESLEASGSARAQTPPTPTVNVTVDSIAPGVWYLAGQSHHTVAIETARSIVLVEAPQSDARALAVIEKARTLVPGKPVDLVINTHHHFDHSGGVRAAISQGLTVMTHEGNRDFYERTVFARRHSVVPDALSRTPKPLRILSVRDRFVRRDSLRTIELYRIDGSQHSGSMLMAYLPAEKLLIEADLYSPPAPTATTVGPFPFAANLLDNIQRRGLEVERIVPIHGRVVPFADLQAAAATTATSTRSP